MELGQMEGRLAHVAVGACAEMMSWWWAGRSTMLAHRRPLSHCVHRAAERDILERHWTVDHAVRQEPIATGGQELHRPPPKAALLLYRWSAFVGAGVRYPRHAWTWEEVPAGLVSRPAGRLAVRGGGHEADM